MFTVLNNRYRIIATLGSGGCGQTFLAEDTYLPSNPTRVVKLLHPTSKDPAVYQIVKERFQREASILEVLGQQHDQIPRLHAYFTENQEFYLVQDYIAGQNLLQKLHQAGPCPEHEVQRLLLSLLGVLDYLHAQGIIHRDIKPDNIMLRDSDKQPVLIDFGAVKEVVATVANSQGVPVSSIIIGSPGFMPLEQTMGRPVFASDIFALGMTAICLLTGKYPQEMADLRTGDLLWQTHAPGVSAHLAAVLDKATRRLSEQRYQTAREMIDALQPATTIPNPFPPRPEPSPLPPTLPTPQPSRIGVAIALAGVALMLALLVSGFAIKKWMDAEKAHREAETEARLERISRQNAEDEAKKQKAERERLEEERKAELASAKPTATFQEVHTEHNVLEGGVKGMRVHAKFSIKNCKGVSGNATVYFFYASGDPLKDTDTSGRYRTPSGHVSVLESFTPTYDDSLYEDFKIFFPYSKFPLGKGEYDLKYQVELRSAGASVATSDYVNVTLTNK